MVLAFIIEMEGTTNKLKNRKDIQKSILNILCSLLMNSKIKNEKFDIKMFLNCVSMISNNHRHSLNFFDKIY